MAKIDIEIRVSEESTGRVVMSGPCRGWYGVETNDGGDLSRLNAMMDTLRDRITAWLEKYASNQDELELAPPDFDPNRSIKDDLDEAAQRRLMKRLQQDFSRFFGRVIDIDEVIPLAIRCIAVASLATD